MDRTELAKITNQRNEDLAKSLGYSNFKEMKGSLSKKNLSGDVKSRLEQGGGIAESIGGGMKSNFEGFKKSLSPKKFATDAYNNIFDGDDIFSAYMRGRIKNPGGSSKQTPEKETEEEEAKESGPAFTETLGKKVVGRDKKTGKFTKLTDEEQLEKQRKLGLTTLTPTAVNGEGEGTGGFNSSMADDVSTIRKSIASLVTFEKEKREQSERKGDAAFFKAQDAREASLEKSPSPLGDKIKNDMLPGGKKEKGGGIISTFLSLYAVFLLSTTKMFKKIKTALVKNLPKFFKKIFSPKNILKGLIKIAAFGLIWPAVIMTVLAGIIDGFQKWKEGGTLGEVIVAGLGGMLDFLTFGLFGEDSLKKLFKTVGDFAKPIIDDLIGVFKKMKDWAIENIGIPSITIPIPQFIRDLPVIGKKVPESVTIPEFYPLKKLFGDSGDTGTGENPTPAPAPAPVKKVDGMTKALNKSKANKAKKINESTKQNNFLRTVAVGNQSRMNSPTVVGNNNPTSSSTFGSSAAPTAHKLGTTQEQDEAAMGNFLQGGGIDSAMGNLSSGTAAVPGAMDNAANVISNQINAGGVTPNPVTPFGAASSGAVVERGSIDVESGQREESMGSGGSVVNSPSITNNSGSMGNNIQPVAPVINFEFANGLQFT